MTDQPKTDHISDARQMVDATSLQKVQRMDQLSGNPGELDLIERLRADRYELIANHAIAVMRVSAERDEAVTVLTEIAKGETPPEQHGHYLAHRQAVKAARTFLQSIARETGK